MNAPDTRAPLPLHDATTAALHDATPLIATPDPITAVLDIPAGSIRLIAADRTDTEVEVRPADPGKSSDVKAARLIQVSYDDGVLRVEAAKPNLILGDSGTVAVTVRLPAGSRIDAKAAAGELHGLGRLGDVAFEGALGRVGIAEAAEVRLALQAGDVSVGRLAGSAEISTQSGDITVAEAVRGSVVLRTRSGRISVGAARGVSATLDAGTGYGRVSNSLKNDGASELTIHATTDRGDISAQSL